MSSKRRFDRLSVTVISNYRKQNFLVSLSLSKAMLKPNSNSLLFIVLDIANKKVRCHQRGASTGSA
jgi:hypothetical protein